MKKDKRGERNSEFKTKVPVLVLSIRQPMCQTGCWHGSACQTACHPQLRHMDIPCGCEYVFVCEKHTPSGVGTQYRRWQYSSGYHFTVFAFAWRLAWGRCFWLGVKITLPQVEEGTERTQQDGTGQDVKWQDRIGKPRLVQNGTGQDWGSISPGACNSALPCWSLIQQNAAKTGWAEMIFLSVDTREINQAW